VTVVPAWIRRRSPSSARDRLASAKPVFERELEERISRLAAEDASWAKCARGLLSASGTAEAAGEFDQAWAFFLAATRMEIFGLDEAELAQRRTVLLVEAQTKLSSWRREAVAALLGPADEARGRTAGAEMAALHAATFIRDEAAGNRWRDVRALGRRIAVLGLLLALAVAGVLLLAWIRPVALSGDHEDAGIRMWAYVTLFGALGGSLSALRSVTAVGQRGNRTRNPQQVQAWYVTVVRPLVGAAAALGVFAVLAPDVTSTAAMLGLAFAAGFSEAVIVRAVESAGGRDGAKG
jgi:hypothetical protein